MYLLAKWNTNGNIHCAETVRRRDVTHSGWHMVACTTPVPVRPTNRVRGRPQLTVSCRAGAILETRFATRLLVGACCHRNCRTHCQCTRVRFARTPDRVALDLVGSIAVTACHPHPKHHTTVAVFEQWVLILYKHLHTVCPHEWLCN